MILTVTVSLDTNCSNCPHGRSATNTSSARVRVSDMVPLWSFTGMASPAGDSALSGAAGRQEVAHQAPDDAAVAPHDPAGWQHLEPRVRQHGAQLLAVGHLYGVRQRPQRA